MMAQALEILESLVISGSETFDVRNKDQVGSPADVLLGKTHPVTTMIEVS